MIFHQWVALPDLFCHLDEVGLADPGFLRPGKLDDELVTISDLFGTRWFRRWIARLPSSSNGCRAASQADTAVDEVVLRKYIDLFLPKVGSQDACPVVVSNRMDARPLKLGEETPSRQIEPLEDKKDQEEVR